MQTLPSLAIDRVALATWYRANRNRSAQIFTLIEPTVYYEAPLPLRHPFVFYEGHFPAFSFITLVRNALGRPSINARLEELFNRGIDPGSLDLARAHRRSDWPSRDEVQAFGAACDERVLAEFACATLSDPSNPQLVNGQAAYNILEHEEMHHETLLYIVHRLPNDRKRITPQKHRDVPLKRRDPAVVSAGWVTLGAAHEELLFGWDNEFEAHHVDVPEFGCDIYDVTNAEYQQFVEAGGPIPPFWIEIPGSGWGLRTLGETIPLPASWPVYVTNAQAAAFAAWSGAGLMTEAQYHRAAYGTPFGDERSHPWGDGPPTAAHGNFNFERYDPEPVGSRPAGVSAWGIHDLVGNGWEWTSTPFAPLPGFSPMASYLPYSADFFDGEHCVMKGASPVTSRNLIRRSFRNWYRRDYPYMYATFRRVWQ